MAPSKTTYLKGVLGPTNTGKTHLAVERMLGHNTGMIGLPLRLLAREIYDKVVAAKGKTRVALITGEEKIVPANPAYYVCTVEAMPITIPVSFLAIDEVQLAADRDRGHVFTQRLLAARGMDETMLMGADTIQPLIKKLLPGAEIIKRRRFSELKYAKPKKLTRLPKRTAVVAFSMERVYAMAELLRRTYGGVAVVIGALSPKTRNAQVALYQSGQVDYLVATDAIGMGLNMDIDHVVFAEVEKFDGQKRRRLFAHELAQIAGRAGRHMASGTFSALSELGQHALMPEDIARIENHAFPTLKVLQWRNFGLDFTSTRSLIKSLEKKSDNVLLVNATEALDLRCLKKFMTDEVDAKTPEAVQTLWQVCQIPDFLQYSEVQHMRLLKTVYGFLSSTDGRIPHEWMAKRVSELDNVQGNIETLMGRIAAVRTWTYISHRTGWLAESEHWAYVTRNLENKLSAALHEALTQRFVDKRTSALMKNIGERSQMTHVDEDGLVTIEGQELGHLKGFCFFPTLGLEGENAKTLLKLAEKHLRSVVKERLDLFLAAVSGALALNLSGATGPARILWNGETVAHLVKGRSILAPEIKLSGHPLLDTDDEKKALVHLTKWIAREFEAYLGPLMMLDQAATSKKSNLPGITRGLAFRLSESLGVIPKHRIMDDVRRLSPEDRSTLHKVGFWFGAHFVFVPNLLKPAPTRWRLALWGTWNGVKKWPELPEAGLMSANYMGKQAPDFYQTLGYHLAGKKIVRIDRLEKLADAVRPLGMNNQFFAVTPEIMGLVGLSGLDFAAAMKVLGYAHRAEKKEDKDHKEPKDKYLFKWSPQKGFKRPAAGKKTPTVKQTTKAVERRLENSPFAELKKLKLSGGKS